MISLVERSRYLGCKFLTSDRVHSVARVVSSTPGQPDTVGWAAKCDDFSMAHNRKRSHGWRSQAKPKAHGLHTDAAPHRPGAAQNSPTAQPSLCARRRRVQGVRRSVPKISPESKKNILLSPAPGGKYRYARVREREIFVWADVFVWC